MSLSQHTLLLSQ